VSEFTGSPAAGSPPSHGEASSWDTISVQQAAELSPDAALRELGSSREGLSSLEVLSRLAAIGPNVIRSHTAGPLQVLLRQVKNPLLILLTGAAVTSLAVGEYTDAGIILGIICLSVGLGFFNEYRASQAVKALHSQIHHMLLVLRDGKFASIDVTDLVPGDIVRLDVGDVVPADVRLITSTGLECDESVLTGEATPAEKHVEAAVRRTGQLDLPSCAFMGTVVRNGSALALVVTTGQRTEFGHIAERLGEGQSETAFQQGLRGFSVLLVQVTTVLTLSIFVTNAALQRPLLDSALFSLAIAVGLTPQLLPAIVTISLSTGARRLARKSVIVKRLVSIEDLGNIEVLFTDKTGTLTEGRITFSAALNATGERSSDILRLGLLCNSAAIENGRPVGGNQLDQALWEARDARVTPVDGYKRLAEVPFDYERRLMSVLIEAPSGARTIIVKGAPESVLKRCVRVSPAAQAVLDGEFDAGVRVVAIAVRDATGLSALSSDDERDLELTGFLTFVDRAKGGAAESIARLNRLGVSVKIVTGDNGRVAQKLCADLGVPVSGVLTGTDLETMTDDQLTALLPGTTIFARVTPEEKSRIIRAQRTLGSDVGFLGDGVNDAVALHDADVGISVDTGSDIAKDAADIVLLDKDLGILADGIVEGRRIFANTIKYVLMGTSSNFGNMFSAAGASLVLSFLPMLPSQILLNNLLYDVSEMTIPTDRVDEELLQKPSHWDTAFIRRFMMFFGPISSLYDFLTFAVMLWVFNADEKLFHSGWFVESLATQTLVIFVIRTRRVPFFRSLPSRALLVTTLLCVIAGALLPYTPLAGPFGFVELPADFFLILALMVATYLGLVELGKSRFFRLERGNEPVAVPRTRAHRRTQRIASRWHRPHRSGSVARDHSKKNHRFFGRGA
jgi:Mg2+-importing ATPase